MQGAVSALLVDPDLNNRLRFKQAAAFAGIRLNVSATTTLLEALQRLDNGRACEVIYLSSRYDREVVSGFVSAARKTRRGSRAAMWIVLPAPDCAPSCVAGYTLAGADGILVEPYSAQTLEESITTALRVRTNLPRPHQQVALGIVLRSVLTGCREYIKGYAAGRSTINALQKLAENRTLILDLSEERSSEYQSLVLSYFLGKVGAVPPSAAAPGLQLSRRMTKTSR
jgi:CheY-like chemotaxis protein